MQRLTKIAVAITAAWALAFAILIVSKQDEFASLTLNEWGDFLAGASAPLALFWLVIGYFQHGQELRLNTRALNAQEEELRRQVEATTTLGDNAQRQAEATEGLVQLNKEEQKRAALRELREAQPDLVSAGGMSSGPEVSVDFRNRGGGVVEPELIYDGPHRLQLSCPIRLDTNSQGRITLVQTRGVVFEYPVPFGIAYRDRFGEHRVIQFEFHGIGDFRPVTDPLAEPDPAA